MEHFQWDDYKEEDRDNLESELADIVIYCLFFAVSNNIDISKAVKKKVDYISKKYPADLFAKKDDPKDYWRIKRKYRSKKTE